MGELDASDHTFMPSSVYHVSAVVPKHQGWAAVGREEAMRTQPKPLIPPELLGIYAVDALFPYSDTG